MATWDAVAVLCAAEKAFAALPANLRANLSAQVADMQARRNGDAA
jgi:hypothetical protein